MFAFLSAVGAWTWWSDEQCRGAGLRSAHFTGPRQQVVYVADGGSTLVWRTRHRRIQREPAPGISHGSQKNGSSIYFLDADGHMLEIIHYE
jgi:catechol 2,3-dioxygenase-like lactoylglutathione lyase family enzyme